MLCEVCHGLNLSADDFIVGNLNRGAFYDDYHNLGTVCSVRHRTSICSLCRIALETLSLGEPTGRDDIENNDCELYWQGEGFLTGDEEPKVRFLKVFVRSWSLTPEYHRICLLGIDAPRGAQRLFLGRKVPDKIAINRVKSWIRSCQRWHGEDCINVVSRPSCGMPPGFRVIDTWNRCIVNEPPCECIYVALSYVWGGKSAALKLSMTNSGEMGEPGALKRKWQKIPRTIQDAIILTSSLGQRFLWVDSLCIIQDDDQDKNALIPFMDLIYDRAFLTIVAATGQDSEAGLPGLCRGTRYETQKIEELKPGLRVMSPKHLSDALEESYYETRGWTTCPDLQSYQERILSRRCLFFINGQIMFQCRSAVYREDVVLEDWQISGCQDEVGTRFRRGLVASDEPHNVYTATLWEYSNRKLSFDTDVINAFTGVLQVLHRRMVSNYDLANPSSSSTCGLPMTIFDWALLWEPVDHLKRRSDTLWPSWSWSGWNGRISMLLPGMNGAELQEWLLQRTWIKWVFGEYRTDIAAPLLSSINDVQRKNLLFPSDLYPPVMHSSYTKDRDQPVLHDIQTHRDRSCNFLYFATLSMTLSVQPTDVFRFSLRGYKICKVDGTPCGKIWLEPGWENVPDQKNPFLALSEAKSSEISQIELPARGAERDASEWDAYHVIMISCPNADSPAERIALGIILKTAMREEFGAVWKEVWLQ